MHAGPDLTSAPIRHVRDTENASPKGREQTTDQEAPPSRHMTARAPPRPTPVEERPSAAAPSRWTVPGVGAPSSVIDFGTKGSEGLGDPIVNIKARKASEIKTKFGDIFSVRNQCEEVDHKILEQFSDSVSVAGRLSSPSSIEFFRHLGASEFILTILSRGHHPELNAPVPRIEKPNNASFRKHRSFAIQEVERCGGTAKEKQVNLRLH